MTMWSKTSCCWNSYLHRSTPVYNKQRTRFVTLLWWLKNACALNTQSPRAFLYVAEPAPIALASSLQPSAFSVQRSAVFSCVQLCSALSIQRSTFSFQCWACSIQRSAASSQQPASNQRLPRQTPPVTWVPDGDAVAVAFTFTLPSYRSRSRSRSLTAEMMMMMGLFFHNEHLVPLLPPATCLHVSMPSVFVVFCTVLFMWYDSWRI